MHILSSSNPSNHPRTQVEVHFFVLRILSGVIGIRLYSLLVGRSRGRDATGNYDQEQTTSHASWWSYLGYLLFSLVMYNLSHPIERCTQVYDCHISPSIRIQY
ncbi:hypothetical protein BDZ45DRAFT_362222 [Acephala macrosclerotiorum]|nr:hypothetical protein BDZ45DRAFT_362222 [Acephala macrosclerotiorum]